MSVIICLLFLIPISRIKKKQIRKQLLIKLRKIISQSLIEDIFETILDKSVDAHAIRIL